MKPKRAFLVSGLKGFQPRKGGKRSHARISLGFATKIRYVFTPEVFYRDLCVKGGQQEYFMSWYRLNITIEHYEKGYLGLITDRVGAIKASKDTPDSFNVFLGRETAAGLTLYFTPDSAVYAAKILAQFKASPCEKPPVEELTRTIMGQKVDPSSLPED